jgi:hypothetical protein
MHLSYKERSRKLRTVAQSLGYLHPLDLLYHYLDHQVVPGICTNEPCDCIANVEYDTEAGLCTNCNTFTVQSVLVIAGVI